MQRGGFYMQDWQRDTAYYNIVKDLLAHPQVQELANYTQHHHSDRLTHSIAVSYVSYKWALRLGLNATAVARAGILHDLFFYDWRTTKFELGTHAFIHPRVSLREDYAVITDGKGYYPEAHVGCDSCATTLSWKFFAGFSWWLYGGCWVFLASISSSQKTIPRTLKNDCSAFLRNSRFC